jgi:hypothetical protein
LQVFKGSQPVSKTYKFNINYPIRIKVTERGHIIYERTNQILNPSLDILPLKVDAEGYTTMQLWQAMLYFGAYFTLDANMFNGRMPFEPTFPIRGEDLEEIETQED